MSCTDFKKLTHFKQRVANKKRALKTMQESFLQYTKEIQKDAFERNAINMLLNIQVAKAEIRELEELLLVEELNKAYMQEK